MRYKIKKWLDRKWKEGKICYKKKVENHFWDLSPQGSTKIWNLLQIFPKTMRNSQQFFFFYKIPLNSSTNVPKTPKVFHPRGWRGQVLKTLFHTLTLLNNFHVSKWKKYTMKCLHWIDKCLQTFRKSLTNRMTDRIFHM